MATCGGWRCLIAAVPLLTASLVSTPLSAQILTGNDLHDWCSDTASDHQAFACLGYIRGVASVIKVPLMLSKDGEFTLVEGMFGVCVLDRVTDGQIIDIVKKYLKERPERRHTLAHALIIESLLPHFPCAK